MYVDLLDLKIVLYVMPTRVLLGSNVACMCV